MLLETFAKAREDRLRRADADVGCEQDFLDLIGDRRVELFLASEEVGEAAEKSRLAARFGEAFAKLGEVAGGGRRRARARDAGLGGHCGTFSFGRGGFGDFRCCSRSGLDRLRLRLDGRRLLFPGRFGTFFGLS